MASQDIQELVVKVTPEGVQETTDQLRGQRQEFEESADAIGDETGKLAAFSKRWKGAGLVFAGGFAAMTGAIVAKLPVLREVATGFDILLTSLALTIDEDIRPSVGNLTDDFTDLAEEIGDADTAAEGIGLALGGLADMLADRVSDATDGTTVETSVDFIIEIGEIAIDRASFKQKINTKLQQEGIGETLADGILTAFPQLQFIDDIAGTGVDAGLQLAAELTGTAEAEIERRMADAVNAIIEQINRLPFIDIGMLEEPSERPNIGVITDPRRPDRIGTGTGGTRGGGAGGGGGGGGLAAQTNLQVNLDSRTIAEETKSFNVRGALARGRGSRVR